MIFVYHMQEILKFIFNARIHYKTCSHSSKEMNLLTINIGKRNGKIEPYSREKLERSMKTLGVSDENSKKVIKSIEVKDGMRSNDIRKMVSQQLEKVDKKSADRYNRQRRITFHQSTDLENGTIIIDDSTLTDLNMEPGDSLDIVLGSNHRAFVTSRSTTTGSGAFLNNSDLRSIGINEGNRIIIQKREDR